MLNHSKISFLTFLMAMSWLCYSQTPSFKKAQLKNSRVKTAYSEKWSTLKISLNKVGIDTNSFQIFIRVFKKDKQLELWIKSKSVQEYKLFHTYLICASSGDLGPKRMQGDGQVPEGFYNVSVFNPYSNYYLSLGVSYPNKSDKVLGSTGNLGGDIMIHGNCVTIGCMPLTDDKIKEVYVLAVEARNSGEETIPVHIFPTRMNDDRMKYLKEFTNDKTMISFWENIKKGFDYFEQNKKLPVVSVDEKGKYGFK